MSAFECVRKVYQSDGIKGFYRGMSASYAGISETVIHFVIYESIKQKLLEYKTASSMDNEDECVKEASDFVGMMMAAATSKTCATSIAYPHGKWGYFIQRLIQYPNKTDILILVDLGQILLAGTVCFSYNSVFVLFRKLAQPTGDSASLLKALCLQNISKRSFKQMHSTFLFGNDICLKELPQSSSYILFPKCSGFTRSPLHASFI